jgi:hypothetical protein
LDLYIPRAFLLLIECVVDELIGYGSLAGEGVADQDELVVEISAFSGELLCRSVLSGCSYLALLPYSLSLGR